MKPLPGESATLKMTRRTSKIQALGPLEAEVERFSKEKRHQEALEAAHRLLEAAGRASLSEVRRLAGPFPVWLRIPHFHSRARMREMALFYRRALRLLNKRLGPSWIIGCTWIHAVVSLYESLGRRRRGVRLLEERARRAERVYGLRHVKASAAWGEVVNTCSIRGDLRPLKALADRAARAFGREDRLAVAYRYTLAAEYGKAGRVKESNRLFRDAAVCGHLRPLKEYLLKTGARITQVSFWNGPRRWLWFNVELDLESFRKSLNLARCVQDHDHFDPHYWREHGFVCKKHRDGIMSPDWS